MKKLNRLFFGMMATATFIAGCNNGENQDSEKKAATTEQPVSLSLKRVAASPEFPQATLGLGKATAVAAGSDSAKVTFEYNVKNYELKAQTSDNSTKGCNNSDKGQHIHFILDNSPYKALYEPKNDVMLANNTEHVLLSFLSRSYHEALKNKEAAVITHFKIDEHGKYQTLPTPTEPLLFYSRPKGDYAGNDTTHVLLDFYIANCTLSDTGFYVNAHVMNPEKGRDTTFKITTWEPNFIENLGTGKCKAELSLIDAHNGNKVLTTVSRDFNLVAEPATK